MLMSAEDPARLRLVASAIAGRPVDVAACEPGAAPWTDGATIFLDASWPAGDQLRALAVQASLLGAGSLEPDVLRTLARRPGLARRYLSVEGRRALQTRSAFLPPPVWPLVDPTMAARSASPAESLALAAGRLPLVDPPPVFGVIRPGAVTAVAAAAAASAAPGEQAAQHVPRRHGRVDARELDEDEDVAPGVDLFSSPVGGGGGIGKLLKRLFGEGRSPSAGPPGADAPTRRSRR
ncbi:MAG TPA: hypothetical protein VMU09_13065, partial [Acidimicrobiales bacterium]|nr:hypothetical protein [Acidimicrobiales bacterium]